MSARGLIAVSIGANLVLAGAVIHLVKSRFAQPPEKISVVTKVVTNVSREISEQTPSAVTNFSPLAAFHWQQIESAEYPVYIANLRNVHCPEKTIRNILIPDIEELYDARRRDELQPAATNFWVSGRARTALNREHFRKQTALDDEEAALVKQLLGIDWVRNTRRSRMFLDDFEMTVMPYLMTRSLPMEKAKEFGDVLQKYQRLAERIEAEASHILLPDDERKLKALRAQMKAEIGRLVPADELEEMSLRATQVDSHSTFEDLKDSPLTLTADELRKISALNVALMESHGQDVFAMIVHITGSRGGMDESSDPTPQELKQVEEATKSLLGDARYAMFQEATDGDFQSAKNFVEQEHLPVATSRALFEMQKAAEDRAEEIRADKSLRASDRKRALQEVRATTEATLADAMGAKVLEKYRKDGGSWLNNISKKPK